MTEKIVFGPYQFNTKADAVEAIRTRLLNYHMGDKLIGEDEIFFAHLVTLHHEHTEQPRNGQLGSGLLSITVLNNTRLYINKTDGSRADVCWKQCVQPAPYATIVSAAFRRSVQRTLDSFKTHCLNERARCPICGIYLGKDNSHVVHTPKSFEHIFCDFLKSQKRECEKIALIPPDHYDHDQRSIVAEPILNKAWIDYHWEHANLELWSARAALAQ